MAIDQDQQTEASLAYDCSCSGKGGYGRRILKVALLPLSIIATALRGVAFFYTTSARWMPPLLRIRKRP